MSKEQIAAKIADEVFKSDDFRRLREYELLKIAALKALEHQEARVKELEETNRITANLLFERDKKIKELDGLLRKIRDDLRMRGDKDSDGITVVNLSCGLWLKINEVLGDE